MGWNCLVGAYECKNYDIDAVGPDDFNFIAEGGEKWDNMIRRLFSLVLVPAQGQGPGLEQSRTLK